MTKPMVLSKVHCVTGKQKKGKYEVPLGSERGVSWAAPFRSSRET